MKILQNADVIFGGENYCASDFYPTMLK